MRGRCAGCYGTRAFGLHALTIGQYQHSRLDCAVWFISALAIGLPLANIVTHDWSILALMVGLRSVVYIGTHDWSISTFTIGLRALKLGEGLARGTAMGTGGGGTGGAAAQGENEAIKPSISP
eukprot:3879819-Pyramimonas_sp.AAC.1